MDLIKANKVKKLLESSGFEVWKEKCEIKKGNWNLLAFENEKEATLTRFVEIEMMIKCFNEAMIISVLQKPGDQLSLPYYFIY